MRRYLEELSGERPGERLALVTHGGLIRALLAESVPNAGWVATTLGALLGATPDPRAGGAAEGDVL